MKEQTGIGKYICLHGGSAAARVSLKLGRRDGERTASRAVTIFFLLDQGVRDNLSRRIIVTQMIFNTKISRYTVSMHYILTAFTSSLTQDGNTFSKYRSSEPRGSRYGSSTLSTQCEGVDRNRQVHLSPWWVRSSSSFPQEVGSAC